MRVTFFFLAKIDISCIDDDDDDGPSVIDNGGADGHHFDDGDISFFDGIHKRSNQLSQLELFINYQWRNINSSYVQMNG
ncbi:hypothetical protein DERF_014035 [Dermatophagoides farinae]|uniref:Uncharacterized protein n=1 Tax=Dermatophagoides farinae TaxID=6954 RepID=A0A922KYI3_DERFA|nr:hypothetical protein DERF_014035 [Dermatophagoides farinae]